MSDPDIDHQEKIDPILEQLILEGLDSPAEEMTDADWERMKDDLRRRFARPEASHESDPPGA